MLGAFLLLVAQRLQLPQKTPPDIVGMKHANTRQEHGRALKILDICERLNISRETASRLLDSGLLRGFKLDPTARRVEWRILPEDLDAYINEQAAASTSKQRQTRRRRPSVASYL